MSEETPNTSTLDETPAIPKELEGKSVAEIWKMVEQEKNRTNEANRGRERAEALAQEIAMVALEGRGQPATAEHTKETGIPDKETDPEGWAAFDINRRVDAKIKPLADAFAKDHQMVMGGLVDSAKLRVASQFHDWAEHEGAINEFLKNYPAEVLAQTGALEEAYYRVKGRAVYAKERENLVREQASMGAGGRVGVLENRQDETKFSDDTLRVATELGADISTFTLFKGGGSVNIDDYLAAKQKDAEAKKKGGTHATR